MEDISNKKFNMLTAIGPVITDGKYKYKWKFKCDCGSEKIMSAWHVQRGKSKSCGCGPNIGNFRHGNSPKIGKFTKVYIAWMGMIQRCSNESYNSYARYGGRGIKVCDRWKNSFENFLADMGEPPTKEHSLDRFPNNDGNYELENCRWATRIEQESNKSTNVIVEWNGEKKTLTEWSRILGFKKATLFARINVGWTVDRTFSTKTAKRKK